MLGSEPVWAQAVSPAVSSDSIVYYAGRICSGAATDTRQLNDYLLTLSTGQGKTQAIPAGYRALDRLRSCERAGRQAEQEVRMQLAEFHRALGQFAQALRQLDTAETELRTWEDLRPKHTARLVRLLTIRSGCLSEIGLKTEALKHLKEAFQVAGQDTALLLNVWNELANYYYYADDYLNAIPYYEKILAIDRVSGSPKNLISSLGNLGNAYDSAHQTEKAQAVFEEGLNLARRHSLPDYESWMLNNLGVHYINTRQYRQALDLYLKGLPRLAPEDTIGQLLYRSNICLGYFHLGQPAAGYPYGLEGYRLAEASGSKLHCRTVSRTLASCDSALGRFDQAYRWQAVFFALKDSLNTLESSRKLGQLENQLLVDRANAEAQAQAEAQERALRRRNTLQYFAVAGIVLLLFLALFSIRRLKLPPAWVNGLVFATFLLFFEFLLVVFDPIVDSSTQGSPLYKLLFNTLLAAVLTPVHHYLERIAFQRLSR
jgi:tetratricopeptide (TPR) repeat protein